MLCALCMMINDNMQQESLKKRPLHFPRSRNPRSKCRTLMLFMGGHMVKPNPKPTATDENLVSHLIALGFLYIKKIRCPIKSDLPLPWQPKETSDFGTSRQDKYLKITYSFFLKHSYFDVSRSSVTQSSFACTFE